MKSRKLRLAGTLLAAAAPPARRLLLVVACDDGTVQLRNVSDPARPRQAGAPLAGHSGVVNGVAFGPDGLLASACEDKTVRLWDVAVLQRLRDQAVEEEACQRAGRGLTEEEWARFLPDDRYQDTCDPAHRSS